MMVRVGASASATDTHFSFTALFTNHDSWL